MERARSDRGRPESRLTPTSWVDTDGLRSFIAGLVALSHEAVEQIDTDPDSIAGHRLIVEIAEGRLDRFALDSEVIPFAALNAYTELRDGDDDDDDEAFWQATSARQSATGK